MKLSKEIRFLLVGAWNTAFGYGVFAALYGVTQLLGVHYLWALVFSQVVSIANAYIAYKRLVFKTDGNLAQEGARFVGVYGALFVFNLAILPPLVGLGLHPLVAQAVAIAFCVAGSYVAHNKFTFKTHEIHV